MYIYIYIHIYIYISVYSYVYALPNVRIRHRLLSNPPRRKQFVRAYS